MCVPLLECGDVCEKGSVFKKGKGGRDINSPQPIHPPLPHTHTPTHPPTHPHTENTHACADTEGSFSNRSSGPTSVLTQASVRLLSCLFTPFQFWTATPQQALLTHGIQGKGGLPFFFLNGCLKLQELHCWLVTHWMQCDSLSAWLHSPFPPVTHIVVRTRAHTEESFQWNGTGCIYIMAKILKYPGIRLWTVI